MTNCVGSDNVRFVYSNVFLITTFNKYSTHARISSYQQTVFLKEIKIEIHHFQNVHPTPLN